MTHSHRGAVLACLLVVLLLACASASARAAAVESSFTAPPFPAQPTMLPEAAALAEQQGISASQALEDLELQSTAGNIAGDLKADLGAGYAGVWFDLRTGTFHVPVAPSTAESVAQQVASAHGVTGHVVFDSVAHTWAEVESETDHVRKAVGAVGGSAPVEVVPVVQKNAPVVELETSASSEQTASVANAAGNAAVVRVPPGALKMSATSCAWPYCDSPLRGGIKIKSTTNPGVGSVSCTAGAYVQDASGYRYLLTAGHCVIGSHYYNYPNYWYTKPASPANECQIGVPTAGEVSSRMDAEVIGAPGPCFSIAPWIVEWGAIENYPVHGVVYAYAGLYECHQGASSVNQCGTVEVAGTTSTIEYHFESGTKIITVEHMDRLCAIAIVGDSGGPVQYGNLEWTYLTAITTASNEIRTGCSSGSRMSAYEIPYAEAFIGVHVIT
jgi:hypothetical protein